MNEGTLGKWPRCDLYGKARSLRSWGSRCGKRCKRAGVRGKPLPPPKKQLPGPKTTLHWAGVPAESNQGIVYLHDCPQDWAPEHPDPSQGTLPLPHHPSLAPPAPELPKQTREVPALVYGGQGPTGHGPQSMCRVAEEYDWAA